VVYLGGYEILGITTDAPKGASPSSTRPGSAKDPIVIGRNGATLSVELLAQLADAHMEHTRRDQPDFSLVESASFETIKDISSTVLAGNPNARAAWSESHRLLVLTGYRIPSKETAKSTLEKLGTALVTHRLKLGELVRIQVDHCAAELPRQKCGKPLYALHWESSGRFDANFIWLTIVGSCEDDPEQRICFGKAKVYFTPKKT
jgi:hypothetical protein